MILKSRIQAISTLVVAKANLTFAMKKRVEFYTVKEVVHANRACEIIKNIHRPQGRACRKDGIKAIVKCFLPAI